jgi:hypothetical protein
MFASKQSPLGNECHVIAVSRPFTAAGTALVGASIIATSAISPVQVTIPRISDAAIELQASVLDIFAFPATQQAVANQVEYAALWAESLAAAGAGVARSLAAIPQTLITATQQVFNRDPLGALTTVEDAAAAAAEAILVPLVLVQVDIGQIQLAVESALLLARPEALVQLGVGLFGAWDTVTRAVITAGQNFVNAVLTLNPANIIAAVVGGVQGVATSFVAGGQVAVDGIVAAQTTLATALAARPAPPLPVASNPARTARAAAVDAVGQKAPRRASARAVQRDNTTADVSTSAPTKTPPAAKRAARSGAAS